MGPLDAENGLKQICRPMLCVVCGAGVLYCCTVLCEWVGVLRCFGVLVCFDVFLVCWCVLVCVGVFWCFGVFLVCFGVLVF